jgi:hypothetical protein
MAALATGGSRRCFNRQAGVSAKTAKQDHQTGHELSRQALQHSTKAHEKSLEAHRKPAFEPTSLPAHPFGKRRPPLGRSVLCVSITRYRPPPDARANTNLPDHGWRPTCARLKRLCPRQYPRRKSRARNKPAGRAKSEGCDWRH